MTLALMAGAALGASLLLLVLTLVPPRRNLAAAVGRWDASRSRSHLMARSATSGRRPGRLVDSLAEQLGKRGVTFDGVRPDLELLDTTLEEHLAKKLSFGILGLVFPSVLAALMAAAGITPPWSEPLIAGVLFALVFFTLPDLTVKAKAAERRDDLRRALSCYLDLVSMAMAGGRAVPEALPTAAQIGRGPAFETITRTVTGARQRDTTPWAALSDLGTRTRMQELRDLGGALSLVADDGAKVRASLTARAATLRRRRLAEVEGAAEKSNTTMNMCSVLFGVTLILFLGYPAAITILAF